MANPMLNLVRNGLQLWLRDQCDAVDDLHLHLNGTPWGLLQGRLDTVRLHAQGVVRGMYRLSQVIVTCNDLQLDLNLLRPDQPMALSGPLLVRLEVRCSAMDLQHMLLGEGDAAVGVALLAHFRGLNPEDCRGWKLQITESGLRFLPPVQDNQRPPLLLQPKIEKHNIAVYAEEAPDRPVIIPLDPAIRIHKLTIDAQHLHVQGKALVRP